MASRYFYTALFFCCTFFVQCSPGKKTPETTTTGNFERLIKKLEKNPGDEKAVALAGNEYKKLQLAGLARIREFEKAGEKKNDELILKEYKNLQHLYSAISSVPGLARKLSPANYSEQIYTLSRKLVTDLAAETDYLLAQGDKASCRKSYYNLLKQQDYQPDNKLIAEKLNQSLRCATVNVIINEPAIENNLSHYRVEFSDFYSKLVSTVRQKEFSPFVKFENNAAATDETIVIHFESFKPGVVTKENISRDVVNNVPYSSGRRRGGTSTGSTPAATITTTYMSSSSTALARITVIGKNGEETGQQEFTAQFDWSNEQNSYSGDRRAIPANERAQIRASSKNPPAENELISEMLRQLNEKILNYLQNRYAGL